VEQGNGDPSLFVTFYCAEYHWQDIDKLFNDRRKIAGNPPVSLKSVTEKVRAVNNYSIIIQEYFQVRVSAFLENYAKEVFGVHHYYTRLEFAKSRGQIHVHILAMLGNKSIIIELNERVYKERHDVENQARVADDSMENVFGLTAIHPGSSIGGVLNRTNIGKPEGTCETPFCHPASQTLLDVTDYKLDICNLCNCCQMHNYSGYRLYHKKAYQEIRHHTIRLTKKRKSLHEIQAVTSTAKHNFQVGAGHEEHKEHVGIGDTPEFECDPNPSITPEGHGFTKHLVFRSPRNTRRMVQTSLFLTQVWRGNVDVKPFLYQSDPSNPDPEDIVTCSDYLVGYKMKGAQTLAIEKKT
jgi:hypothetical protein